jgi:hypothetical protein
MYNKINLENVRLAKAARQSLYTEGLQDKVQNRQTSPNFQGYILG